MLRALATFLLTTATLTAQSDPDLDAQMRAFISAFAIASENTADPTAYFHDS